VHVFHPLGFWTGWIRLPDVKIFCDLAYDAHGKITINERESLKVGKTGVLISRCFGVGADSPRRLSYES